MVQVLERKSTDRTLSPIKIQAKNVNFDYGETEILKNINLEVREGEFVVFMGPSGSGKSTFLRLLTGLEKPKSGEIYIQNQKIDKEIPELAVVFQDYSLFPWLTAEENIVLALKNRVKGKKAKKELSQLAEQYLTLVNLGHATKKYPGEMSGGATSCNCQSPFDGFRFIVNGRAFWCTRPHYENSIAGFGFTNQLGSKENHNFCYS